MEKLKLKKSNWLKAKGRIRIRDSKISIEVDSDFCKYYSQLYKQYSFNTKKINLPKHGSHINIYRKSLFGFRDLSSVMGFNGKNVEFQYNILGNFGGFEGGFKNFWFDVYCKEAHSIANILNLPKQSGFSRFHITIFNSKNT